MCIRDSIEAGEKSYRRTLKDLKEALEKEGVVFLDPVEGERGAGVALKWDFDPASVSSERADDHDSPEERSLSAIAWDEPSASQEILEQRAYWAAHPDRWAKLSEAGKAVLTRELGL